jgi:hypothetical protein
MSDTKQFLEEMMPRIHRAETALHNGDAGPRFEMWSHTGPVTFSALRSVRSGGPRSVQCSRGSRRASRNAARVSGR